MRRIVLIIDWLKDLFTAKLARATVVVILLGSLACNKSDAPPGKMLIKNDILDKEYNVVAIDGVTTDKGPIGFRARIKPGERIVIPAKGVTGARFTRDYKDHTNVYEIRCPGDLKQGISINLIDVHTNRISGGCKLVRKGAKEPGGAVRWEDED